MRLRTLVALAGLGLAVAFGVGDAEAARRNEGARNTPARSASVGTSRGKPAMASSRAGSSRQAAAPAARQRVVVSRGAAPRAVAGNGRASSRVAAVSTGRKGSHVSRTASARGGRVLADRATSRAGVRQVQLNRREMRAVASNTCLRRDARGRCTGARLASFVGSAQAAAPRRSWHSGLPDADGEQMACPEGTLATLARGHTDTIRCMPL